MQYNVNIKHFVFCKCRSIPVANPFITYFLLEMVPKSLNLKTVIYRRLNVLVAAEGGPDSVAPVAETWYVSP